jgi:ribose-phosphate pyrophosphokinase
MYAVVAAAASKVSVNGLFMIGSVCIQVGSVRAAPRRTVHAASLPGGAPPLRAPGDPDHAAPVATESIRDGAPAGLVRDTVSEVREIVVFSGNAHPVLARRICDLLGVPLSPASIERFSNDCLQVQLQANCRQRDVYIVQPLVPPTQEHLMELMLMLDAARGASAARITAVIPHYAYARSDKKDASRISIGGRLVADLLITAGAMRVITMTLHAPQVHGFFGIPVDHLTAIGELAEHFRETDLDNAVVVSPDLGNAKTATQFSRLLGVPVAAGSKQRLADDRVVIDAIVGNVAGKRPIVLDDEIATGASLVELLSKLEEEGALPDVAIACTHGLFTGKAVERLQNHLSVREVVTTDTVPPPLDDWPGLRVRSVARLFAEAIRRSHDGESVTSLFDGVDPAYAPPQGRLDLRT